MSKQRSKNEYRVGVGASSILMVLVVLALTAVGLLSFSSARNLEVLTRRNVEMTSAYYTASAEVQKKLAVMDAKLVETQAAGTVDPQVVLAALESVGIATEADPQKAGQLKFAFSQDAGHRRHIDVAGVIALSSSSRYQVTQYQLVSEPVDDSYDYDQYHLLGE